ncbi:hypothetical protein Dda3937_04458 [Dickeya dadantii 3937]|uniref:Uncharacterized protein n=1 Tax=Dickeya dadantii (strain 3937) TaxID=198628 RepID=E0SJY1_DICD3|nr:hypothetical protein Dda3937_04458 [Dickeya dadantii 3937]
MPRDLRHQAFLTSCPYHNGKRTSPRRQARQPRQSTVLPRDITPYFLPAADNKWNRLRPFIIGGGKGDSESHFIMSYSEINIRRRTINSFKE